MCRPFFASLRITNYASAQADRDRLKAMHLIFIYMHIIKKPPTHYLIKVRDEG